MRVNERMKKLLSIVLTLCMVLSYIPAPAYAVGTDCTHHAEHTAECGYVEAVAGVPCAHVHDENCGYVEAVAEVLCACEATDENGAIVHTEGCGYVAPVTGAECTHVHDDACGYVAAVEGHECHYECAECAIAPANEEPGDETPVCSCTVKCGETADTNCAVCSAAGADLTACIGEGQEEPPVAATNNIDAAAMTAEELKAAVDAALAAGYTAITVNLAADADMDMFTALRTALAESTVPDGSINLTISGAKTVPEYGFFDDGDYSDNDDKNIAGDKLKSLTLTDVETIGEYAFSACTYLESVNLPQVVTIGECAFNEWKKGTKLTSLNLPNATTIGDWAFAYSSLLTSVNLPKVTSIGMHAFGYCDLRTLNLPEVTTIDGEAFLNNDNLVSCSAPKAITIDYYPWGKCSRMETLELTAAGGFTLGNNLFAYTSTEQIDLVLNKDKESQVTQNADGTVTWKPTNSNGEKLEYTFKSITFVYSIEVSAIENGTVTADKSTATEGETVTLTVTAAEGYILDTLTVMNGGTPVEVTGNSFTMPAGDVTVSATFKACDHSGGAHTSATDLGDGKHSFTCSVCDTSVTEPHSIGTDGKCACGAMEIVVSFDAGDYEWKTGETLYFCRVSRDNEWEEYCFTATVDENGAVTWTPDKPLYWDGTGEHRLFVSYPCTTIGWDDFAIPTDQSDAEKLKAADCMNARWVGIPTTDVINFELKHRMAKITVEYVLASQFDGSEDVTAQIHSNAKYCIFSDADGLPMNTSVGQYDAWVTPHMYEGDVIGHYLTAYVAPGKYDVGSTFIKFYVDGCEIPWIMREEMTFEEGGEYNFEVKVGKDRVSVWTDAVTVTDYPGGWNSDSEENLNAEAAIGTPDEGKNHWAVGDQVFVNLTSDHYGAQTVVYVFDGDAWECEDDWADDFEYLEGEVPTVTAIYAPCYAYDDGDEEIVLADGMQLGMTEYLEAKCSLEYGEINVNFAEVKRTYSRLRIVAQSNQTLAVTATDFTPVGTVESGTHTYTLTADDKGNAYLYGIFAEGANLTVNGATSMLHYTNGTEHNKSYAVCASHTAAEGAEATCLGYRCEQCGLYFGNKDESKHVTEMESNKATCQNKAKCDLCGTEYGEVGGHSFNSADGKCSVCQNFIAEASVTIGENTTYYETLTEAATMAQTGTEAAPAILKLEQSVDLGSECLQTFSGVFTLDLNGKTLSSSKNNWGALRIGGGSVTITDTGEGGTITHSTFYGIAAREGCTVTIEGGTIIGYYVGVDCMESTVIINGGTIIGKNEYGVQVGNPTADVTNSTVTINGGTITGSKCDLYNSRSTILLGLGENGIGATFPDGLAIIQKPDGFTLKDILGEGAAYWQDGKMLTVADDATSIDGTVTVMAECKHENATYSDITDTQHTMSCSCGYEVTEEHTFDETGKCVCGTYIITIGNVTAKNFDGTDRVWQSGDTIRVDVWDKDNGGYERTELTYDGTSWGSIITDTQNPVVFAVIGNGMNLDVNANKNSYFISVSDQQEQSPNVDDYDLMYAYKASINTDAQLDLHFEHLFTKITVNIEYGSEFTETPKVEYVLFISEPLKPVVTITGINDGNLHFEYAEDWIHPSQFINYGDEADMTDDTVEVIVGIGTLPAGYDFIHFYDRFGSTEPWKKVLVPEGGLTFVAGEAYEYNVLITSDGAKLLCAGEHSFTYTPNEDGTSHKKVCSDCGYAVTEEHTLLTYSASGNVITVSCSVCHGTVGTATITAGNTTYNGTAQETATVAYSEGWNSGELTVSYANNTNAGTATASITVGEATASVEFTIAKAKINIDDLVNPEFAENLVYDGTKKALVTAHGYVPGGTILYSLTYDGEYTSTIPVATEAGRYGVYWLIQGDENHEDILSPGWTQVIIAAKPGTDANVTLGEYDSVYSGTAKEPGIASVVVDGVTLTAGKDYDVSYENNVYAGTAKAVITFKGNYSGTATETFQISKAPLTVTADDKSMTTGRDLPAFTYTITGFVNGETEAVLTTKPTVRCETDGKTAGEYAITVSGAEAANYDITHVNGTLSVVDHQHAWTYTADGDTITAKCGNADTCPDAEQTIKIAAEGKTYDGTPVTATLTGNIDGVDTPAIRYFKNGTELNESVINAGTYTASITLGEATASVEFTIAKAEIDGSTLINPEFAEGLIYNGTAQALVTKTGSVDGGYIVYSLSIDGEYTTTIPVATEAGNYRVYWTIECDENHYVDGTPGSSRVTIAAKAITVTADAVSKTYGDTDPTLTYKVEGLVNGDELTGELKRVAGENVGSYAIEQNTLTAGNNYIITYTGANFTIRKADPAVTAPAANDRVYDGTVQELLFAGSATGGTMVYSMLENGTYGSIPVAENAGTYTVWYMVKGDSNHNDTAPQSVTVTIAKAPVAVLGTDMTVTYNGQDIDLRQMFSIDENAGAVDYTIIDLTGNGTFTDAPYLYQIIKAGTFTVKVTTEETANYLSGSATAVLTVNKAAGSGTVTMEGWTYGENANAPVASGTGAVTYRYNTEDGKIPANAGTYTVTAIFGATDLYEEATATAEFTIAKKSIQVTADAKSKTYGNADPALTYTVNGLVGEDQMTGELKRVVNENVGTYAIELNTLTAGDNYTIFYTGANFTINPKPITVKADAVSKIYGETDPTLTYTVNGLVGEDQMSGELKRVEGENVGTYAIEQNTLTAGNNYTITYTGAEFTVNKRAVTVTAKDQTIVYGTEISGAEYTAAGLVEGHTATATLTPSTEKVTANGTITAGTAVITADGTDVTANYEITYTDGKLVIQPDTSKIDGLTTENVTSANEADIKAVQEMLENADSIAEEWNTISETCKELMARIEEVRAENARIEAAVSAYDVETVKSSDEEAITQLISDIDAQLATDNLTAEERTALEEMKAKCNELLAKIAEVAELIAQLDKTVADMDEETVKSTDKETLEQVIKDAQKLIDSGNVTDEEKETLKKIQEEAKALIQVIDDIAAAIKEAAEKAESYDEDSVNSADKAELKKLAEDIEALLDTENLTEEERAALEKLLEQAKEMISIIDKTAAAIKAAKDLIDARDPETVTSEDKDELERAIDIIEGLLNGNHLTYNERNGLADAKAEAEEMLDAIEAAQKATETENTGKVEEVTSENVKPEDKEALEAAKEDLEKALEENGSNYTEEEKQAIREEIQRIEEAIKALENVETVVDGIAQLPETVEPDDEATAEKILASKAAYEALTDHEKSLVDEAVKSKLDQLLASLSAYDIIEGDEGQWTKGSGEGLGFVANGPLSKFVGIVVDEIELDKASFETKSGSTVITLIDAYLEGLTVGEHTITVVYTDGETSGTFTVLPKAAPTCNILLWIIVIVCLAVVVIVLVVIKKRRSVK